MANNKNKDTFSVELTDEAFFGYASIASQRVFDHVDTSLGLLETSPYLGETYDPIYEAARPDFPCRVLYCEYFGIYYRVDEDARRVIVFALEDQRRNPQKRFSNYDYAVSDLASDEPFET